MPIKFTYFICAISLVFVAGLLAIFMAVKLIASRAPAQTAGIVLAEKAKPLLGAAQRLSFFAVGDIMLSRTVAERMRQHGAAYPFAATSELLQTGDFAFGNLEAPITAGRTIQPTEMVFRADPGIEQELKAANFGALSLANNHIMNFGPAGLSDTVAALAGSGIVHAGAGTGASAAHQPALVERQGVTLAFLAYTYDGLTWSPDRVDERAGAAGLDLELLARDISQAKEKADFVIVSMHAGAEYTAQPSRQQTVFAHAAVDAGAELVIGHHPHVIQTAEKYQGKYILYSLGNFIFDQMWSADTQHGMMAQITIDSNGLTDIRFIPLIIEDYCQPRPATPEEADELFARLGIGLDETGRPTEQ